MKKLEIVGEELIIKEKDEVIYRYNVKTKKYKGSIGLEEVLKSVEKSEEDELLIISASYKELNNRLRGLVLELPSMEGSNAEIIKRYMESYEYWLEVMKGGGILSRLRCWVRLEEILEQESYEIWELQKEVIRGGKGFIDLHVMKWVKEEAYERVKENVHKESIVALYKMLLKESKEIGVPLLNRMSWDLKMRNKVEAILKTKAEIELKEVGRIVEYILKLEGYKESKIREEGSSRKLYYDCWDVIESEENLVNVIEMQRQGEEVEKDIELIDKLIEVEGYGSIPKAIEDITYLRKEGCRDENNIKSKVKILKRKKEKEKKYRSE